MIGSTTKAVTTLLAAKLVDHGERRAPSAAGMDVVLG